MLIIIVEQGRGVSMDFLGAMSDFLTRQGGSLGSASNFGSGNIPLIAADGVTNPLYRVWIQKKVNGQHLTVSTPMPESWSIQLAIPWAQQFASLMQSVAGKVIGSDTAQAVVDMAAASGRQVQNCRMSARNKRDGCACENIRASGSRSELERLQSAFNTRRCRSGTCRRGREHFRMARDECEGILLVH